MNSDFIYIDEYGLLGSNFYWKNRHKVGGVTDDELKLAGLVDERVQVHKDIIQKLIEIDKRFQQKGFRMYIKEGYRSKDLYELVYRKRIELFGKEETDRLINMKDMPHASGKTIDVALWNAETDTEVMMRNRDDGTDALFVDFYKNKEGEEAKRYQELQDFVIAVMQEEGFEIGVKNEYFHFNLRA